MQIRIYHDEGEMLIDSKDGEQPGPMLDDMMDIFTKSQVPHLINEGLRTFRALCNAWNQRELAERRELGISDGTEGG